MAGPLPATILVALAAVLGGADALRELAGPGAFLDIAICAFAMCVLTAYLLGTVLVVRVVREGEAGPAAAGQRGGAHLAAAAATDCFAKMTMLVSVGVAFLAAACLLAVPSSVASGSGSRRDARSLFPRLPWRTRTPVVATPVGVAAVAAVAGTTLLVGLSRRARTGPGAALTPATDTRRSGKLTSVAVIVSIVVACLLAIPIPYACAPPGAGGEHACSACCTDA